MRCHSHKQCLHHAGRSKWPSGPAARRSLGATITFSSITLDSAVFSFPGGSEGLRGPAVRRGLGRPLLSPQSRSTMQSSSFFRQLWRAQRPSGEEGLGCRCCILGSAGEVQVQADHGPPRGSYHVSGSAGVHHMLPAENISMTNSQVRCCRLFWYGTCVCSGHDTALLKLHPCVRRKALHY